MSSPSPPPCRVSELRLRIDRLRALDEQDAVRRHTAATTSPPPSASDAQRPQWTYTAADCEPDCPAPAAGEAGVL